jgi:2-polyprenyl-3-methyl-5-hydroxy-6-metoxy-1,4-benzoquinol methylase
VPFEQVNFNDKQAVVAFIKKHENSFDLVLGVEVIEHVENPWEYVRTLKAMVKPGGHILISTPNTTSWLSRMIFLFSGRFHQFTEDDLSYGHIAPITTHHLNIILRKEAFEEITTESAGLLPPFWLRSNGKLIFFNFLNLFFYPFMRGVKRGWCIITTAKKS